ncbi:hypothetical protein AAG906_001776 [Vitis piasezkii]
MIPPPNDPPNLGIPPNRGPYITLGMVQSSQVCEDCSQDGMWLILHIGPFVAAEWNFGWGSVWLHYVLGTVFQTNSEPFKDTNSGLHCRNVAYDSSMGGCLHVLHFTCSMMDLIWLGKLTPILKISVALCNAYIRIAKTCPHISKLESLICILLSLKPLLAIDRLLSSNSIHTWKRPIQDRDICKSKRQKLEDESMASDVEVHVSCKLSHIVTCERGQEHANYMHISLLSFVELLKPHVVKDKPFRPKFL